jgi:hypothetical protein
VVAIKRKKGAIGCHPSKPLVTLGGTRVNRALRPL